MPAYLIQHPGRPREDIAITGDDPTLAIPAADGATIQRIDPDDDGNETDDGPAPGR